MTLEYSLFDWAASKVKILVHKRGIVEIAEARIAYDNLGNLLRKTREIIK